MKTEDTRWSRLRDLFSQAMDLAQEERDVFINANCGGDRELSEELRALVSADLNRLNGPLTSAVDYAMRATSRDRRLNLLGNIVGSYRLVSILGHGGAGTVYLAERADRQYSAQVAVKIVESALLHAEIGQRFRAERQILASLNHPNIARLIDAGETSSDQPYLVMEYVHGEPIDQYCDDKQLNVEQRLELFLKVCSAVQYAHQNLIVHRDLKPANILVAPDGTPKLLDFGIAKLLDTSEAAAAMSLTRVNDRILTPEYASPEQILGQVVTTTSDVYALGVVLFELLTGTRPYEVSAVSQLELERSICVTDPQRPSAMIHRLGANTQRSGPQGRQSTLDDLAKARSTTPKRLQRQLSGDLDAIVLRALRKEPEKRYSSVERLVEDIRRHLENQPVVARQGNWIYYTQRFARRHAFGVSVTIAAAIVLVAFSVITSVQRQRIATALDRVTQERQRAETVSNFMLNVFTAADPFVSRGKETTARELLDQAGQSIAKDLNEQPEVRARLLEAIGRAHQRQSQPELAIPYLQDALRLESRYAEKNSRELADTLSYLGSALRDQGNFADAEKSFKQAEEILSQRQEKKTEKYAQLLSDMARLEHVQGKLDSAEAYFESALTLIRELHGTNHPEAAAILNDLTSIMQWKNDWGAAERFARESARIYQSTMPELHPDRIKADYGLGSVLMHSGKLAEASTLIERTVEAQRKIYGDANASIAATLDTLSSIRKAQGRMAEAEQAAREALAASEKSQGKNNFNTGYYRTALASLLIERKNYREAEQQAREAFESLKNSLGEDHQYVASAEYVLAEIFLASRRAKEAEPLLVANISRWQRSGAAPWRAARSENALGAALLISNQSAEAERHLLASYRVLTDKTSGATDEAVRTARERLANYYVSRNESDKAVALLTAENPPPSATNNLQVTHPAH